MLCSAVSCSFKSRMFRTNEKSSAKTIFYISEVPLLSTTHCCYCETKSLKISVLFLLLLLDLLLVPVSFHCLLEQVAHIQSIF